jgi:O-antigen/teichoic acid export membrane protein
MGIIRKQSIQTSILSYLGVGLGYINVVLLFPKFFEPEQFGLTRVLVAVIGIATRFALVGASNSIIRFYPQFKEDKASSRGLLKLILQVVFAGSALVVVGLTLGKPWVLEHYSEKSILFVEFYFLLFPFLLFEVAYQVLTAYLRANYHTVISIFYREVFLRVSTTCLIGLYYFDYIVFNQFMVLFIGQYGLIVLGLAFALNSKKIFSGETVPESTLDKPIRVEMFKYSALTFFSGIGGVVAVNIDVVMIGSMIGLGQIAFYTVAVYVVAIIRIPYAALNNVATPVVADAWKYEDVAKIQDVYSKTSINQLVFGTLLFVGIWANEHNIFSILPSEYSNGKWVLFFVGLARLIEVGFGIGSSILTLSKQYFMDVYAVLVFLIVAILTNFMLIPIYGINGAAVATAISLSMLHLSRFMFLKLKFGFQPFTWKSLMTILLGGLCLIVDYIIPVQENWIVDIIFRSSAIVLVFIPLTLTLKLSEDINNLWYSLLKLLKR